MVTPNNYTINTLDKSSMGYIGPPLITIVLQLLPNNHAKDKTESDHQTVKKSEWSLVERVQEMTSAWRVVSFFLVVFVVPTILIAVPLYARYHLYHSRTLFLTDGDVISLHDTVSSFWCQSQKIKSNGTFDAFFTREEKPSLKRRTSRLSTSLVLTYDEVEAWGFHLLEGSSVEFSSCSRWPGGTLIVVQGKENMKKCFYREQKTLEELQDPLQRRRQKPLLATPTPDLAVEVEENHGGERFSDDTDVFNTNPNLNKISQSATLKYYSNVAESLQKFSNKKKLKDKSDVTTPLPQTVDSEPIGKVDTVVRVYDKQNFTVKNISPLSFFNETAEVTYGNSSYSSSEEFMSHCLYTIYYIDLSPYLNCKDRIDSGKHPEDIRRFTANQSDKYYFLFSSDNSIEINKIDFNLILHRALYDVSESVLQCQNSTADCIFPLPFLKGGGVVLDVKGQHDNISLLEDLNTYEMTSYCQPRSLVYTVLILLVPFVIVLFAFR